MSTENIRQTPRRSVWRGRAGVLPMAAVLAGCTLGGCSSDSGGAFDEFVGTWTIDPETSRFTLTCPFLPAETFQISLWNALDIQPGVLSDLVETSGACPFFFDVVGKAATMLNPDPYTGEAPICRLDESTETTIAFLEFQPMSPWNFNLRAPEKDKPPRAQMIGNARAPFIVVDAAGGQTPDPAGPCMYVVTAELTKIAKN